MKSAETQRTQAVAFAAQADRLAAESPVKAIDLMRQAVLHYASADKLDEENGVSSSSASQARADACQRFGDYLTQAGNYPEAANIYQEAADIYARVGGEYGDQQARACAHKILEGIAALRSHPADRLYLLVAHHERQQRQLALEAGTEQAQAECAVHIARIFQRRERPLEAIERYREALTLYALAPPTSEILLSCAECHHRIATLLDLRLDDVAGAAAHYREAITLYTAYEPVVYGIQESRSLCLRALEEIEREHPSVRLESEAAEEG